MPKVFTYTGDGIGPEITQAIINIFKATKVPIILDDYQGVLAGDRALKAGSLTPLPQPFIDAFKDSKIMLKAPMETPKGKGFKSINVSLRQAFDLYANIRPARSIPGIEVPVKWNDKIIFVYENDDVDNYDQTLFGKGSDEEEMKACFYMTTTSFKKALQKAIDTARNKGRKKITLIDKGNIVKAFSLGLDALAEVRKENPDLIFESIIVDNFTMQMIKYPEQFDIVVVPAMFKNIIAGIREGLLIRKSIEPLLYENVNILLLRENTEDLYANEVTYNSDNTEARIDFSVSEKGYRRIFEAAAQQAKKYKREKITFVTDQNMFQCYKLGTEVYQEFLAKYVFEFDEIEYMFVQDYCKKVITDPSQFDVVVTTNMLGDILSDLHAGLVGGLGVVGSANVGDEYAMFEAVHGTAPDIAGKGIANPTGELMAAIMMLRYMHLDLYANRIEAAMMTVLADKYNRTGDLGGKNNTEGFMKAIIAKIQDPTFDSADYEAIIQQSTTI